MINCFIGRWTFTGCTGMSVYIVKSRKLDDHEDWDGRVHYQVL